MYHAFALMTPDSNLTIEAAATQIKAAFPDANIQQSEEEIKLNKGDWDYQLVLQKGSAVHIESEGLAGHIAGLEQDSPVRNCDRRLELWSDTPDPFLEYMDNHFKVLEALRSFKGVILVDPKGPELL